MEGKIMGEIQVCDIQKFLTCFSSIKNSICFHDCFIMHGSPLNKLDRYISSMHRVDSLLSYLSSEKCCWS